MLVESACYDSNAVIEQEGLIGDDFSQSQLPNCSPSFSMEDHRLYHHQNTSFSSQLHQQVAAAAASMEMEQGYSCINTNNLQEMAHQESTPNQISSSCDPSNCEKMNFSTYHQVQVQEDEDHHHQKQQQLQMLQLEMQSIQHRNFTTVPYPETPYPPTPNLLNMLPLLPSSSIPFADSAPHNPPNFLSSLGLLGELLGVDGHVRTKASSSVLFDPLLPVNLPPQPPFLRDSMHSLLPHGYNLGASSSRTGSLFSTVVDDREASGGLFQDGEGGRSFENGVFEFAADIQRIRKVRNGKDNKQYVTERQRRVQWTEQYQALRSLIPNPTKNDRASIVADAIGYIHGLKRKVGELTILVEKKRCSRERLKRQKVEDGAEGVTALKTEDDLDHQPYSGSVVRSSWLHRKSKTTEVDVRIIDDEVTVKLVQQKGINSLLLVSKVLDELQLDLHHVAGGLIGDYFSFLINSKICEGSTVYAHAIANKIIEVVDIQ